MINSWIEMTKTALNELLRYVHTMRMTEFANDILHDKVCNYKVMLIASNGGSAGCTQFARQ